MSYMPLIDEPRCPQCGQTVPTRELWRVADTNKFGLLKEDCGVVCPQCGVHLRIRQSRIIVFYIASIIVAAVLVSYLSPFLHNKDLATVLVFVVLAAAVALQFRYSPCFARLEIANDVGKDKISYPLSVKPVPIVESDEERDARELQEVLTKEPDREFDATAAASWKCLSCGEENPGNFTECWKCQTIRPETGS